MEKKKHKELTPDLANIEENAVKNTSRTMLVNHTEVKATTSIKHRVVPFILSSPEHTTTLPFFPDQPYHS